MATVTLERLVIGATEDRTLRDANVQRAHVRGCALFSHCVIGSAVIVGASARVVFERCRFRGNGVESVACLAAQRVEFRQCTFWRDGCVELFVQDCPTVICTDCAFDPAVVCGIFCVASGLTLEGCALEGASVLADEQSFLLLLSCHVRGEGVVLSTGCTGSVRQCLFSRCPVALLICPQSKSAVPVTLVKNVFEHNDTAVSAFWGPELRRDDTNVFDGNGSDFG